MGGVNWYQFTIDLIDAVLMGIPSATIAQQINQQYAIEYGQLLQIIEGLQAKANSADLRAMDEASKASQLRDALYGANPMGAAYSMLRERVQKAEDASRRANADAAQARNQASKLNVDAAEAARKSTRSLGQIVAEDYNLR